MEHICVYGVCFPWQCESKNIAYSLHGCLSKLFEQGYNITAQITLTPISVCQKMSNHPSIYFCYIYFFLSPEIWILVISSCWREKSMTVCCKCYTEYQTGNTATHALCYQAVMLFVYIAMSYDEVWVVFWKWFIGNHIFPHCCSTLDTMS